MIGWNDNRPLSTWYGDVMRLIALMIVALTALPAPASAEYQLETVATGLEHPWSLAWLPDGRILVTERPGRLRVIDDGTLLPDPVAGVPQAHVRAQAGLFEVLPAPDFAETGEVFLSMARGSSGINALSVFRARMVGHGLEDVVEIFRAAPEQATSVHYGGRLLFLPDGTLLATIGDGFDHREEAQSLTNHWGSVVRLRRDGTAPDDNPFADRDGARPEIFSFGHRNIQGIALDTETGRIWASEHGPRGGDELNAIEAGENYGWPVATHGVDYTGARITPYREVAGMRGPLRVWTPAIAPSGLAVYRGPLFPDWEGDILIGGLVSQALHRLRVVDDEIVEEDRIEIGRRVRDVRVGPDGAIYLLTDHADGALLRIAPAQ